MTVVIDGESLTLDSVHAVAVDSEKVELSVEARARIAAAREVVLELLERGDPVYGLTTGLAERKSVELTGAMAAEVQRVGSAVPSGRRKVPTAHRRRSPGRRCSAW